MASSESEPLVSRQLAGPVGSSTPAVGGKRDGRLADRGGPLPEAGRQHLLKFRQRADGCFADPGYGARRGGAEAERDCHRLLVVKQQRRQRGTGREP